MNEFFDELGTRWVVAARKRGAAIEAPTLDARVAAHTHERRFAPLACYVAGVAAARSGFDNAVAAEYIHEVWKELDAESA